MTRQEKAMRCAASVVLVANLLVACSGGPSESEFVTACLKEGENVASKMLDREMGIKRDVFCKCLAKEAKSILSADAQRAMILDMEGKKHEASAISSNMNESEQMAFMKGATEVVEKCAEGK